MYNCESNYRAAILCMQIFCSVLLMERVTGALTLSAPVRTPGAVNASRCCVTEASPRLRSALHFVPALRLFKISEIDILEVILHSFFPPPLGFATVEARNPAARCSRQAPRYVPGARLPAPRRSSVRGPQEGARLTPVGAAR